MSVAAYVAAYVAAFLGYFPGSAFADQMTDQMPSDAKLLGGGRAGISNYTQSYTLFMNPANLAYRRNVPRFEILNGTASLSGRAMAGFGSQKNPMQLSDLYPDLKSNPGEWGAYKFSLFPHMTSRFVTLGFLYEDSGSAKYQVADPYNRNEASLRRKAFRKMAPTLGLSTRFFGGVVRVGYSAQLEYVGSVNTADLNPDAKTRDYRDGASSGVGINQTVGLNLTMPFTHLPSIGLVARNLGGTRYFGSSQERVPMTFDLGVGHVTYFGKWLTSRISLDYRDLSHRFSKGTMRHLFMGYEIGFGPSVQVRAGFSQGYPSAGLSLNLGKASLDFAWYSEEMAEGLRSDRGQRFAIQLRWSFSTRPEEKLK